MAIHICIYCFLSIYRVLRRGILNNFEDFYLRCSVDVPGRFDGLWDGLRARWELDRGRNQKGLCLS